jgi:hypothetical protein
MSKFRIKNDWEPFRDGSDVVEFTVGLVVILLIVGFIASLAVASVLNGFWWFLTLFDPALIALVYSLVAGNVQNNMSNNQSVFWRDYKSLDKDIKDMVGAIEPSDVCEFDGTEIYQIENRINALKNAKKDLRNAENHPKAQMIISNIESATQEVKARAQVYREIM